MNLHWSLRVVLLCLVPVALISATVSREEGTNDFRLSDMGTNGDSTRQALIPVVAYNSTNHEFLVAWHGNDMASGEREVYGQRISASTGGEIGVDFRISDMGPDGDAAFNVSDVAVAYNSTNNEYLVVWRGDDNTGTLVDNEFEIFAQRLNAATGAEIGTDFRVSNMGTDGQTTPIADVPWVVYNKTNNEYLLVWRGHPGTNEFEIYGQRLNAATGAEVGASDFRISFAGPDGDTSRFALDAKAAWNSVNNEYLVVWQADVIVDNEVEIYGQRLNAATGAAVAGNFRISNMGVDGVTTNVAQGAHVAHNPIHNEYLVVWYGTDPAIDPGAEVFGQRLNAATGADIGSDFRISAMGPNDTVGYNVNYPSVAYSAALNEYLVVWPSDDNSVGTVDNEFEIWGQRLNGQGQEVGPDDFRLSDMGPDGSTMFAAGDPEVAFASNGVALVVFRGDDNTAPLVDDEPEIFGQFYRIFPAPVNDFSGDGLSDQPIFRPSTNAWWIRPSAGSPTMSVWGSSGDMPVAADYDGDAKADIAVWRPSTATWWIKGSLGANSAIQWGQSSDIPVPGDYDGDGKTDLAVWRPGTGEWWVKNSAGGLSLTNWGLSTDKAVPADYDGDGRTDRAVWRPSDGRWWIRGSLGATTAPQWGQSGDLPVPGDYDADGKADLAIWRPSTQTFWVTLSSGGATARRWGQSGDQPLVGDWDGDAMRDFTIWRPSDGSWWTRGSIGGAASVNYWGTNGDKPIGETGVQ